MSKGKLHVVISEDIADKKEKIAAVLSVVSEDHSDINWRDYPRKDRHSFMIETESAETMDVVRSKLLKLKESWS